MEPDGNRTPNFEDPDLGGSQPKTKNGIVNSILMLQTWEGTNQKPRMEL